MRFRFNGDSDCPDWILAEVYTLSKLPAPTLKTLAQIVCQAIITPPLKMEKVDKLFVGSTPDSSVDLQSCVACLTFLLSSATRFSCDSSALQSELQQLGLPHEHSSSIKKMFEEYNNRLLEVFKKETIQLNRLEAVSAKVEPETNMVKLDLKIDGQSQSVNMTKNSVESLLKELTNVRKIMSDLKGT